MLQNSSLITEQGRVRSKLYTWLVFAIILFPILWLFFSGSLHDLIQIQISDQNEVSTPPARENPSSHSAPHPPPRKGKTPVEGALDGTLVGRVVFDGVPPVVKEAADPKNPDYKHCEKAPLEQRLQQNWVVNKDNHGVANVAVFLKAPKGKYFKFDPGISFPKEVTMDQPFCAFVPHVVTMFPSYFDGQKQVKTGQKLKLLSSAPFPHNANFFNEDNGSDCIILQPKDIREYVFRPSNTPVRVSCGYHPWMTAYVWVFDHAYAAITNKDGKYKIDRIPSGAELLVLACHEEAGFINDNGPAGQKITLAKGENALNFTIRK